MSEIYLRDAQFSNFRVYGDSFTFEFPPGPGVTLITGGNGLGKTSFFDGVEWALTNEVRRFNDSLLDKRRATLHPLTRVGAQQASHRVSLRFSDGSVIDRGNGFAREEADIIRILKRADWAEIGNLHGYLSITHFFGQASTQRFSLKKPSELWEALRGPAGVDRVNNLRERLGGQSMTRAFNRAIDQRIEQLEAANNDLVSWGALTKERDRSRRLASSERAISPSHIWEEASLLVRDIIGTPDSLSWPFSDDHCPPEAVLEHLSSLLDARSRRADTDRDMVIDLTRLLEEFESARSEMATLSEQIAANEARLAMSREELGLGEIALREAARTSRDSELQANVARDRQLALNMVATTAERLSRTTARRIQLRKQLLEAESTSARALSREQEIHALQEVASKQRAERQALADELSRARERARLSGMLVGVRTEMALLQGSIEEDRALELRESHATRNAELDEAHRLVVSLTIKLAKHDDRARAIVEAVTNLAHQLGHDDVSCPVCATPHPPGELLALVQAQVARLSEDGSTASSLAVDMAIARLEVEERTRRMNEANAELTSIARLERLLADRRDLREELLRQLGDVGGLEGQEYSQDQVSRLEDELVAMNATLATTQMPETLAAELLEVQETRRAQETICSSTLLLEADVDREVEACRSILLRHPDLWDDGAGLVVDLSAEMQAVDQRYREAGEKATRDAGKLHATHSGREALLQEQVRATGVIAAMNARLAALTSDISDERRRWTQAGMPGEPNAERLAFWRREIEERSALLKPARATLEHLIAGFRIWLGNEQLQKQEQEMAEKLTASGASSELAHQELLTHRIEQASEQLRTARDAQAKVARVRTQINSMAGGYTDAVLKPLNETIGRFAKTLMTGSGSAINYTPHHLSASSQLLPSVLRSNPDGTVKQLEMDPSHYFSEGQLSALSVAALLAASTTFEWSRWKGLLLDDPLQHNDVIHASAFMDLLRQMVQHLGYQIIVSTHDSAEAEFLGRKCASSGIPYVIHDLAPPGLDGLVNTPASEPFLGQRSLDRSFSGGASAG